MDSINDLVDATVLEVHGGNDLEAERGIVDQILLGEDRTVHSDVDAAIQSKQPFFGGPAERCPVVVRDPEVALPGVEVRIEMDDCQRPELPAGRAEQRQGDRVIAPQGKNVTTSSEQPIGACFDLRDCFGDDEGIACDVPRICDLLQSERLHIHVRVVRPQQPGSLANCSRPEPRTRSIGDPAVERDSDDGYVTYAYLIDAGQSSEGRCARKTGDCHRIDRSARWFSSHEATPARAASSLLGRPHPQASLGFDQPRVKRRQRLVACFGHQDSFTEADAGCNHQHLKDLAGLQLPRSPDMNSRRHSLLVGEISRP